jgi:hypothetical protein
MLKNSGVEKSDKVRKMGMRKGPKIRGRGYDHKYCRLFSQKLAIFPTFRQKNIGDFPTFRQKLGYFPHFFGKNCRLFPLFGKKWRFSPLLGEKIDVYPSLFGKIIGDFLHF